MEKKSDVHVRLGAHMRKKTIEKRDLQRKTVLDAAAKVFSEKGFGGTSLGDVAKDLGISRPALYYYFSSKEKILSSLVDEISVKIRKLIEEIVNADMDPVTKLHNMIYVQLIFIMRNKTAYLVIIKTQDEFVSDTKVLHIQAKRAVLDGFRNVIQEGIQKGCFRKVDVSVAALGIIGMISWCAWWFTEDGRLKETEVAEQITQMALASMLDSGRADNTRHEIDGAIRSLENVIGTLDSLKKNH